MSLVQPTKTWKGLLANVGLMAGSIHPGIGSPTTAQ